MDNRATKLLEAAEAVVRARQALEEAEASFARLSGFGLRRTGSAPQMARPQRGRRARGGPPVSERVRTALTAGPLTFGEIVQRVGGNTVAARSALKKDRERKRVVFRGGRYMLKVVAPKQARRTPTAQTPVIMTNKSSA
jgi:hypothetical protein